MTDLPSPDAPSSELFEWLQHVSDFTDVALWVADPHRDQVLFMSRAYETIWGRSRAELYVSTAALFEAILPEDRERLQATRDTLLAGQTVDLEYRVRHSNGNLRHVRTRAFPIRDASGAIVRTAGINEDVTGTRTTLEANRAFLQALENATLTGVAVIDASGAQTYVNPAFCRMVGWSQAELVGARPPFRYWPPEELHAVQEAFARTLAGKAPPEGLFVRFMRKDGARFDVQLLLAPLQDSSGAALGWVASAVDISVLKRAEADLRAKKKQLAEAQRLAHLGSWEWDVRANHITWSDELYRIYGLARDEVPASYQAYLDALHPEDRDLANLVVQQALAERAPFAFEHRIVRPSGELRYLLAQGEVVTDASGTPIRMVGTALDITERKQAEEARWKLHEERSARIVAEEGLRTRDEFLSVAAHELRTPLTSLKLQIQSLRLVECGPSPARSASAPSLATRLEKIDRQVNRLDRLVTTLLDVSRSLANRLFIEPEPLDLAELVADVLERTSPIAQQSGSPIRFHREGPVPGAWDRLRLEQVVENLLFNALKYGQGHPVDLAVSRIDSNAVLVVRDHGIGIAPEDQARIFERFERAVSGQAFSGFGLGLWIVRQVVEAHGGSIRLRSELGKGAAFTVTLPMSAAKP